MLAAMERYFPPEVHWTIPAGGLFLWITLPESLNTTLLLEKAVENKVAYVPGSAFDPAGDSLNTARLNFSNARPENIELGIKRLGQVFETAIQQGLAREASPIVTDVQLLGVN
jgi:DNA-binding transcriptional MocR family regulator